MRFGCSLPAILCITQCFAQNSRNPRGGQTLHGQSKLGVNLHTEPSVHYSPHLVMGYIVLIWQFQRKREWSLSAFSSSWFSHGTIGYLDCQPQRHHHSHWIPICWSCILNKPHSNLTKFCRFIFFTRTMADLPLDDKVNPIQFSSTWLFQYFYLPKPWHVSIGNDSNSSVLSN